MVHEVSRNDHLPGVETATLDDALDRLDDYDWIVFTSVNGVDAFDRRRTSSTPVDAKLAAIGPATAEALTERGYSVTLVPDRYVAEAVVDFMAAGEHLAIRYNTFNNFIYFGISVWKAITDLELLAARMAGRAPKKALARLDQYIRLGQGLLLKFLQAHLEDPAQIRPKEYWYGQEYSYLTRDMIDLSRTLIEKANGLRHIAGTVLEFRE